MPYNIRDNYSYEDSFSGYRTKPHVAAFDKALNSGNYGIIVDDDSVITPSCVNIRSWNRARAIYAGEDFIKSDANALDHFLPQTIFSDKDFAQVHKFRQQSYLPDYFAEKIDKIIGHVFRHSANVSACLLRPDGDASDITDELIDDLLNSTNKVGDDINSFMQQAAKEILITGKAVIYIDSAGSQTGDKPVLSLLPFDRIQSWRVENGQIDYIRLRPHVDSASGYIRQTIIRRDPFRFETYELRKDELFLVEEDSPIITIGGGPVVGSMPIFMLGIDGLSNSGAKSPLSNVVDAVAKLYSSFAYYSYNILLTASPMLTLKSDEIYASLSNPHNGLSEVVISPNSLIALPSDSTVEFLELDGHSLESIKEHIEMLIRFLDNDNCINFGQNTSSESGLALSIRANSQSALLRRLSNSLSSGFQVILRRVAEIYGRNTEVCLELDKEFIVGSITIDDVIKVRDLLREGFIDVDTYIYNLRRSGLLANNADLDEIKEGVMRALGQQTENTEQAGIGETINSNEEIEQA